MHEDRRTQGASGDELVAPAKEDAAWQRAALVVLLAEAPHSLTQKEIERELLGDDGSFPARDGIERALEDLERVGLAHRNGDLFSPSRAARHMDGLLND